MKRTPTNVGYCEMCARLFVLANQKGYSSEDFVSKLMNSELAEHLFNKYDNAMWLGETYVMSSLEFETQIESGNTLSDDVMYWFGYLYRVWSLTYDDRPKEIYKQAPFNVMSQMFMGLHVMSYEMAIEDLKEMYKQNQKCDTLVQS